MQDYDYEEDAVTPYQPVKVANVTIARRVLKILKKGLTDGVGEPIPGKMCVEAVVCYAMGQKHGDNPSCVAHDLRAFKIMVNDMAWSGDMARANGLRRLAVIQLGSKGKLTKPAFNKAVSMAMLQGTFKRYLQAQLKTLDPVDKVAIAATQAGLKALKQPTLRRIGTLLADIDGFHYVGLHLTHKRPLARVLFQDLADHCFDDSDTDNVLIDLCEDAVQALKRLKIPGARYLKLTKLPRKIKA